jgi:hypothetical protein
MNEYVGRFKMAIYGNLFIEAENEEEAREIFLAVDNGKLYMPVDWDAESDWDDCIDFVCMEFIREIKEKPEQTDEEWFNSWQKELYADGYMD